MRVLLIRHGRQCSPLCNVDVALAPEGRRQAELLGERLVYEKVDSLWCSDLIRARETAGILGGILGLSPTVRTGLREISFGDLEGLSDEVIADRFEDFLRERIKMERDMAYPGGECAADVVRRVLPVMEEITSGACETAAVVTHGGVIRSLTAHYLGMDLSKTALLASHLENCGITELIFRRGSGRVYLNRFNDYGHLEKEPELLRSGWSGKK